MFNPEKPSARRQKAIDSVKIKIRERELTRIDYELRLKCQKELLKYDEAWLKSIERAKERENSFMGKLKSFINFIG
jgi:hypothetical protein